MWPCAVQILLCALEAEDVELLRREDGLPLLLRLVHGPWRRGRRRHRRHAGQPPSRRAAPAREGRGPRARGGRRGGEEERGQRARGTRRHSGGAGARVRCHPQPQQTLDAHVVALVALRIMWSGDEEREPMVFPFVEGIRVGRQVDNRFGSSPDPACLPAGLPGLGLGLGCSSTRTRRPRHLLSI